MAAATVELDTTGRVAQVHVAGEVDMVTVGTLGAALSQVISLDTDVVIDVSDATFSDVGSVRLIADARERLRRCGRSLVVTNASAPVDRLVDLGAPPEHAERLP